MFLVLIALFIVGPIAEIFVLLEAGKVFGVFPVIFACVGTAILGGWIIRLQGLAAINSARRDLEAGNPPVNSVVDGVLLVIAAPFLMTPGFITDFIGFSLLVPAVRHFLARLALREIQKRIDLKEQTITIRQP